MFIQTSGPLVRAGAGRAALRRCRRARERNGAGGGAGDQRAAAQIRARLVPCSCFPPLRRMSGIRSDAIKLSTGRGYSQRLDKGLGMPPIVRIITTVALALAASTAFAQDFASVYSSTDTRKCKKVEPPRTAKATGRSGCAPASAATSCGDGGRPAHDGVDRSRSQIRCRSTGIDTGILAVQPHPRHARMAHVEGRAVRDHPALVPVGLGQSQQGRAADAGRDDGRDAAQSRLPRRLCRRRGEWRRRRQRAGASSCRRTRARLRLQAASRWSSASAAAPSSSRCLERAHGLA